MAITQQSPQAIPGRRYGSFAGKEETLDGPHNPGKITQLSMMAIPMGRYGDFSGKELEDEDAPVLRRARSSLAKRRHRRC